MERKGEFELFVAVADIIQEAHHEVFLSDQFEQVQLSASLLELYLHHLLLHPASVELVGLLLQSRTLAKLFLELLGDDGLV